MLRRSVVLVGWVFDLWMVPTWLAGALAELGAQLAGHWFVWMFWLATKCRLAGKIFLDHALVVPQLVSSLLRFVDSLLVCSIV